MTEKQVRRGRVEYKKLLEKKKAILLSRKFEDWSNSQFSFENHELMERFRLVFLTDEQLAGLAFSKIAAETKRSNKIYAYIGGSYIRDNSGRIVDKIYGYMDLENFSPKFIWSLELGDFLRNNLVIDSYYCSGLQDFVAIRNKFFLQLVGFQQETVVNKYKSLTKAPK